MPYGISKAVIDDAVSKAVQLGLCFLKGQEEILHVPFAFTPAPIARSIIDQLETVAPLLGRLTQALANSDELLQAAHAPLAAGDPFFAEMLSMHHELHRDPGRLLRIPLLLQRSDFMLDQELGPRLVECNSIAAGMAPFGEQVHKLHAFLEKRWPAEFTQFHTQEPGELLHNHATANMARAINNAALQIAGDSKVELAPGFLMIVQENEDNVFDQQLLEQALRQLGLRTYRRTFRQLHQQLSSGPNNSLHLEDCGRIHVVYLRAGYQYQDYLATDLDTRRCCDALRATRLFIERHRVAVNATVAQQLATSKRMQMQLANDDGELLSELGFDADERALLQAVFAPMRAVDANTAKLLREEASTAQWVLKNQGEGGGHCLFDADILHRLDSLKPGQYSAWTLMQRLRPAGRERATQLVRDEQAQQVQRLVSEIGLFTAHLGAEALPTGDDRPGHIGYLVRSKPPEVTEGGIHSGFGALDSLWVANS
jgi:glutathione synthetase